jgi:hypothetical protein
VIVLVVNPWDGVACALALVALYVGASSVVRRML